MSLSSYLPIFHELIKYLTPVGLLAFKSSSRLGYEIMSHYEKPFRKGGSVGRLYHLHRLVRLLRGPGGSIISDSTRPGHDIEECIILAADITGHKVLVSCEKYNLELWTSLMDNPVIVEGISRCHVANFDISPRAISALFIDDDHDVAINDNGKVYLGSEKDLAETTLPDMVMVFEKDAPQAPYDLEYGPEITVENRARTGMLKVMECSNKSSVILLNREGLHGSDEGLMEEEDYLAWVDYFICCRMEPPEDMATTIEVSEEDKIVCKELLGRLHRAHQLLKQIPPKELDRKNNCISDWRVTTIYDRHIDSIQGQLEIIIYPYLVPYMVKYLEDDPKNIVIIDTFFRSTCSLISERLFQFATMTTEGIKWRRMLEMMDELRRANTIHRVFLLGESDRYNKLRIPRALIFRPWGSNRKKYDPPFPSDDGYLRMPMSKEASDDYVHRGIPFNFKIKLWG